MLCNAGTALCDAVRGRGGQAVCKQEGSKREGCQREGLQARGAHQAAQDGHHQAHHLSDLVQHEALPVDLLKISRVSKIVWVVDE
jgi:hypothetical protein